MFRVPAQPLLSGQLVGRLVLHPVDRSLCWIAKFSLTMFRVPAQPLLGGQLVGRLVLLPFDCLVQMKDPL
ncbi:unnamed protein product [Caenorhabditis nigoni]